MVAALARAAPLVLAVGAAAVTAPAHGQDDPLERGERLYAEDCVSCHGPDGEGVAPTGLDRGAEGIVAVGPSLADAGRAALDFYLSTGRMPLRDPGEQPRRGEPAYSREQIDALVAYVGSLTDDGGLEIPAVAPEEGDVAAGLELYTVYCAGCHQVVAEGGITTGATVPGIDPATPVQIAEAVRVGPYVMPAFDESVIDEQELNDIVRYLLYAREARDEGGWALGHVGPISEGLVAWLLAGGALVAIAALIGERARR